MARKVSIFGATGSIGQNTLDLMRRDKTSFDVIALSGGVNIDLLAKDAIEFGAEVAVTAYPEKLKDLQAALAGSGVAAAAGETALVEAADRPADWIMSAIVGAAGLEPGLHALRHGTTLALANKESLVTAGALILGAAEQYGAKILPVDSEHSAIFQALRGEDIDSVAKVTITASGGAFRDWPLSKLADALPEQAASHPNWSMGTRITIDSASMFNKAMEVIETHEFFGISPEKIDVLVHPESIVHALVAHVDGGSIAHMGAPDMRHAIGFALNWPRRAPLPVTQLDLTQVASLNFSQPDEARWPALRLAREVMKRGGHAGTVFTAAKERALDAFLDRKIRFTDMAPVVETVLNEMFLESGHSSAQITIDTIRETDTWARARVDEVIAVRV